MMKNDDLERAKIISELDKNLLVSASAGSGKTTILVERMVALVERTNVKLSKMAALTFTKKAAGEFYERFYKKLQLRIKPDFTVNGKDEHSFLGETNDEIRKKDKEALNHVDTCFFGTIDAFYQKILNEHPLEAGLSSNTVIIDDEDFENYLIKKFNEYLKSDNKVLREKASFFAKYLKVSNFPSIMKEVLGNYDLDIYQILENEDILKEEYSKLLPEFIKGCIALKENEEIFRPYKFDKNTQSDVDVTKDNKEAWDYLIENINTIRNLKDNDYMSANWIFKKLEGLRFKDDDKGILSSYFLSACSKERFKGKNNASDGYEIYNQGKSIIQKIIFIETIDFLNLVKKDIYESMIKDGLITFSIATDCLLRLLRNEKENKSVIEDIRKKIDVLLIDECQDTDIKQYEIFFRLTAVDFNSDFRKLTIPGGKLYACGDRKQGIYHFRGADVTTYDSIKELFKEKKLEGLPFDLVTLTDNHRSKSPLINYFNDTFKSLLANQEYDPIKNDDLKENELKFGAFRYLTDKEDPTNVAKLILKLCDKYSYSFKDFMVITSSKDKITKYSKEFTKLSIPCYSEGKIDAHMSNLMDAIINLFKYIGSNKKDMISYLEVLSSPLFNFDITKTIDLSIDYLSKIDIDTSRCLYPSNLLERLLVNEKILTALNLKGIDVLIGIIHLLKDLENNGIISSYDDAIKYLSDLQKEDKVIERLSLLSNNIDAVQIANAHKTKGLEKKVVILTKATKVSRGPSTIKRDKFYLVNLKDDKDYPLLVNPNKDTSPLLGHIDYENEYELGEENRLLYVAATRARDFLFIADDGKKNNKWFPLIEAKGDMKVFDIEDTQNKEKEKVNLSIKEKNISFNSKKTISYISPSKQDASNKYEEDINITLMNRDDALVFGTMTHKLMEMIMKAKDYVLDDNVCKNIASSYSRLDLLDNLIKIKTTIYHGGYPQKDFPYDDILLFAKGCNVYCEVPFSYKENNNIICGSIDLILEKDDEIYIIDYKTDTKDIDHTHQLEYYKKALINNGDYSKKIIKTYIYLIKK